MARSAGILATTVGGIVVMVRLLAEVGAGVAVGGSGAAATTIQQGIFRPWLGFILLVVAACQLLTLLVAATDECAKSECGLQLGAISAITATLYWLLGALTVFVVC